MQTNENDLSIEQQKSFLVLVKALSKAQSEMGGASKDATNPHFGKKYADLESVMEVFKEFFAPKGFAIIHVIKEKDGKMYLATRLLHEAGGEIYTECSLGLPTNHHALGSALTYIRRYSASAILGIHQSDDDGGTADGFGANQNYNQSRPPVQNRAPAPNLQNQRVQIQPKIQSQPENENPNAEFDRIAPPEKEIPPTFQAEGEFDKFQNVTVSQPLDERTNLSRQINAERTRLGWSNADMTAFTFEQLKKKTVELDIDDVKALLAAIRKQPVRSNP